MAGADPLTLPRRLALADAAREMRHDHASLHHGQTGNPMFGWYEAAKWECHLCLALMLHDGDDIAAAFTLALPFSITDMDWWRGAYLTTLAYIDEQADREYMRERLADAIGRGNQERRDRQARAFMDLRS